MFPRDIVKAYQESVWGRQDLTAIDRYFASEAVVHSPMGNVSEPAEMKKIIKGWLSAFPHLKVIWEDLICEADRVVSRWRAEGRHEGEFQGVPATHRSIAYQGATIYQCKDDKIIQYWAFVDMSHLLGQLK